MKTGVKTSVKSPLIRRERNNFRKEMSTSRGEKGSSDIYAKFTDLIIEKL